MLVSCLRDLSVFIPRPPSDSITRQSLGSMLSMVSIRSLRGVRILQHVIDSSKTLARSMFPGQLFDRHHRPLQLYSAPRLNLPEALSPLPVLTASFQSRARDAIPSLERHRNARSSYRRVRLCCRKVSHWSVYPDRDVNLPT